MHSKMSPAKFYYNNDTCKRYELLISKGKALVKAYTWETNIWSLYIDVDMEAKTIFTGLLSFKLLISIKFESYISVHILLVWFFSYFASKFASDIWFEDKEVASVEPFSSINRGASTQITPHVCIVWLEKKGTPRINVYLVVAMACFQSRVSNPYGLYLE